MFTNDKFKEIPVDKETKILLNANETLNDLDVLYQKWFWDGITAESFIFLNHDITAISEEETVKMVQNSPRMDNGSQTTYKKGALYTFVNFNFKTS